MEPTQQSPTEFLDLLRVAHALYKSRIGIREQDSKDSWKQAYAHRFAKALTVLNSVLRRPSLHVGELTEIAQVNEWAAVGEASRRIETFLISNHTK